MKMTEKKRKDTQRAREGFVIVMMVILAFFFIFAPRGSEGAESDFEAISPDCDNCFVYLDTLPRTWGGQIEVVLNVDSLPWWTNEVKMQVAIQDVFKKINTYAEVPFVYAGTTNAELIGQYSADRRNTVLVSFGPLNNFLGQGWIWWNCMDRDWET